MTIFKTLLASAALLGTATAASAQVAPADPAPYVNIGVEALDFAGASGNIVGRVGYSWGYFGVEGEGRVGVIDDNDGFKIDYGIAGYGIGRVPVSDSFDVFARAGYHYTDAGFGDADGFAFGGGGQFNFGPEKQNGIRVEYTNLDDGGSADVYSIAFARRF